PRNSSPPATTRKHDTSTPRKRTHPPIWRCSPMSPPPPLYPPSGRFPPGRLPASLGPPTGTGPRETGAKQLPLRTALATQQAARRGSNSPSPLLLPWPGACQGLPPQPW
ncbi:unnamed protein product, partial [Ectocarpus sp. 12 AP-2014]